MIGPGFVEILEATDKRASPEKEEAQHDLAAGRKHDCLSRYSHQKQMF